MSRKNGLIVCFLLCLILVFAGCGGETAVKETKTGVINGYVCNSGSSVKVVSDNVFPAGYTVASNVKVSIETPATTVSTDGTGYFTIPQVNAGDVIITVSLSDGTKAKFVTTVTAGGTSPTNFITY